MDYIDDQVESVNEWERRQARPAEPARAKDRGKLLVGKVSQFFDRIDVAAVSLSRGLRVGDIIEIGSEEEAVRQRISSMQIEKVDVLEANEGDDVGIKLKYKVPVGSDVYKIE